MTRVGLPRRSARARRLRNMPRKLIVPIDKIRKAAIDAPARPRTLSGMTSPRRT